MNRREFLTGLSIVPIALHSKPAFAQDSSSSVLQAVNLITDAFWNSLGWFRRIGAAGERDYLVRGLGRLNRDLFSLEETKRAIVRELARTPTNVSRLRQAGVDLSSRVAGLRRTLVDLAPRLRSISRGQADRAIELLQDGLDEKGGLAHALSRTNEATREMNLREAQSAVNALRDCQRVVVRALDILRH